jgi:hypothetical protein
MFVPFFSHPLFLIFRRKKAEDDSSDWTSTAYQSWKDEYIFLQEKCHRVTCPTDLRACIVHKFKKKNYEEALMRSCPYFLFK